MRLLPPAEKNNNKGPPYKMFASAFKYNETSLLRDIY